MREKTQQHAETGQMQARLHLAGLRECMFRLDGTAAVRRPVFSFPCVQCIPWLLYFFSSAYICVHLWMNNNSAVHDFVNNPFSSNE